MFACFTTRSTSLDGRTHLEGHGNSIGFCHDGFDLTGHPHWSIGNNPSTLTCKGIALIGVDSGPRHRTKTQKVVDSKFSGGSGEERQFHGTQLDAEQH